MLENDHNFDSSNIDYFITLCCGPNTLNDKVLGLDPGLRNLRVKLLHSEHRLSKVKAQPLVLQSTSDFFLI